MSYTDFSAKPAILHRHDRGEDCVSTCEKIKHTEPNAIGSHGIIGGGASGTGHTVSVGNAEGGGGTRYTVSVGNAHLATGDVGGGAGPLLDVRLGRPVDVRPGQTYTFTLGENSAIEGQLRAYTREYFRNCGLTVTRDAEEQMVLVFLPCLRIMTERPWDPDGGTWKRSGIFGVMTDTRKKFERFWERLWTYGKRHDDSGYDLINYVGMVMRADPDSGWGEWGNPAGRGDEDEA